MRCTGGKRAATVCTKISLCHLSQSVPADGLAAPAPDVDLHHCHTGEENLEERGRPTGTFTSTAVPSPETVDGTVDGTWGERDVGGPVSHRMAMEDYEKLRRELTQLSATRSKSSTRTPKGGLLRSLTGRSGKRTRSEGSRARRPSAARDDASITDDDDADLEAGDAATVAEKEADFELGDFIRDGHFEKRTEEGGSAKKVGVVFKHLTVKGVGASATFVKTLPDAIIGEHPECCVANCATSR